MRSAPINVAFACLLSIALAGCEGGSTLSAKAPATPTAEKSQSKAPADNMAFGPPQEVSAGVKPSRTAPIPLPRPEEPIKVAALPPLEPEGLVGKDPEQVARLLGPAAQVREEPPAIVWAYRSESCVMSLFFYQNLQSRQYQTLSLEFEGIDQTADAKVRCLSAVRAANVIN